MKKVVILLIFVFLLTLMSFMVSAADKYCVYKGTDPGVLYPGSDTSPSSGSRYTYDDHRGYSSLVVVLNPGETITLQPGEKSCKIGTHGCDGGPVCINDMTVTQCVEIAGSNKCTLKTHKCIAPKEYCGQGTYTDGSIGSGCLSCDSLFNSLRSQITLPREKAPYTLKVSSLKSQKKGANSKATSVMNPFPEEVGSIATMLVLFGLLVSLIFLFKRD